MIKYLLNFFETFHKFLFVNCLSADGSIDLKSEMHRNIKGSIDGNNQEQ